MEWNDHQNRIFQAPANPDKIDITFKTVSAIDFIVFRSGINNQNLTEQINQSWATSEV